MSLFACMEGHRAQRMRLHETCQVQFLIRLRADRLAQVDTCNLDEKFHGMSQSEKLDF